MITDLEIVFCTYFKLKTKFIYESEAYENYTAFCLKSGSFSYRINSQEAKTVSAGEMVICPPNCSFSRKIITPAEICMIKFNIPNGANIPKNQIKCFDIQRFEDDMKALENCIFISDMKNQPIFNHFCSDLIYMFNRNDIKISPEFLRAKLCIEQNYFKNISIENLAKESGYSIVHFINKFKKYFGYSPKNYISHIRLQEAEKLLLSTDKLSKEIAALCGFEDEFYFIRFFKKHTGMTPSKFRKFNI